MNRAVIYETFGGPEVLELREVPEPHAAAGEVRVKVAAVGLNPMDWVLSSMPEMAQQFGISLPSGFATDFAGTVDEVCEGVSGFAVGDRVYGTATGRAAADFLVVTPGGADTLLRTPPEIDDRVASTLPVAGLTASAALAAIDVKAGDTVLTGGAAGGVGVFAIQLAKLVGARVIGTASESTFDFLRRFGADPVTYGPGLEDRVRAMAPDGVSAATDLHGTEAAETALALGVPPERISTIAAGPNPPGGVRPVGGFDAHPKDLERICDAIVAGDITVPIAATFPIEQIQEAVRLQADRHTHGKIVVDL
jgi:NADPH:quinone reductase-like Zn-dependent oxidoreductase